MSEFNRLQGERVFCHQCSHEWNRVEGGLLCPNCDSEFTEVIEAPRPCSRPEAQHPPPRAQDHPLYDHHPWPEDVPDPEEDDITTYQWNNGGGNGMFSFTSRTFVTGGGREGRNVVDPMQDLIQNFESLLTRIAGVQNLPYDPQPTQTGLGPFGFMGQPSGPRHGLAPDQDGILRPQSRGNMQDPAFLNPQDMFSMIFSALHGPPRATQGRASDGPPELAALLATLMGPQSGRAGDAVFTNEAFDQVITQLMDQHNSSTAPPPASSEAINALPKKNVTTEMMNEDGKVECSICMEELAVGEEITVLPCDHFFHPQCIKSWLKEHNTCPHCRKPVQDQSAQPSSPNSRRHRTSTSRRPSSLASPRAPRPGDGSMQNPYSLPDSPSGIRERRQQYFGSRNAQDGENLSPIQSRRSGSSQSASGPRGGRTGGQANPSGGAMDWVRSHNPFGS